MLEAQFFHFLLLHLHHLLSGWNVCRRDHSWFLPIDDARSSLTAHPSLRPKHGLSNLWFIKKYMTLFDPYIFPFGMLVTYLIFIRALVFDFHATPLDQILTTTMHLSKVPNVSNLCSSGNLIGCHGTENQKIGDRSRTMWWVNKLLENDSTSFSPFACSTKIVWGCLWTRAASPLDFCELAQLPWLKISELAWASSSYLEIFELAWATQLKVVQPLYCSWARYHETQAELAQASLVYRASSAIGTSTLDIS